MAVKVIIRVLAATVDQEVFLLINKVHDIPLANLVFRGHLDRHCGTGFGAKPAKNAAGKIDAEPFGIAATVRLLRRLHGYAIHRTGAGAEVTGYAALLPVRVPGQDHTCPKTRGWGPFLFRILNGESRPADVLPCCPEAYEDCFYVFDYEHAEPFQLSIYSTDLLYCRACVIMPDSANLSQDTGMSRIRRDDAGRGHGGQDPSRCPLIGPCIW